MPGFGKSGISRIFARSVSADMRSEDLRWWRSWWAAPRRAGSLVYRSRPGLQHVWNGADPPRRDHAQQRAHEGHAEHDRERDPEPVATNPLPRRRDRAGHAGPERRAEDVRKLEGGAGGPL